MIKKKIVIATGGTGGHVFPAYTLASYLKNKNFNIKLTSDKRGSIYLENYDNLNLVKIPSSPLIKKNIFKIFYSFLIISFSIIKSLLILIFDRPSIILGMGGYSSFPICFAAIILRIKFIIYENNLIIGKANKYLLPFAKKIFVSYKELEGISDKYKNKVLPNNYFAALFKFNYDFRHLEMENEKCNLLQILSEFSGVKLDTKIFYPKEYLSLLLEDLRDNNEKYGNYLIHFIREIEIMTDNFKSYSGLFDINNF